MRRGASRWWFLICVFCAVCAGPRSLSAQINQLPPELVGVGVQEHLGETIPTSLHFVNEEGRIVTLKDYFHQGRPVIVVLAYYSCPMLCTLVLNGLIHGLDGVEWKPGTEFEVVSVSVDPRDRSPLAARKKAEYLKSYGRPETAAGWHFLTGTEADIRTLAASLGVSYRWDERQSQYAHPAVLMALTDTGRISRYLYGMTFRSLDLKFALLEAAEGKIGSPLEQLIMFCYHYDPVSKTYGLYARNVMKLSGAITVLVLGIFLGRFWIQERRMSGHNSVPV